MGGASAAGREQVGIGQGRGNLAWKWEAVASRGGDSVVTLEVWQRVRGLAGGWAG